MDIAKGDWSRPGRTGSEVTNHASTTRGARADLADAYAARVPDGTSQMTWSFELDDAGRPGAAFPCERGRWGGRLQEDERTEIAVQGWT